MPRRHAFAEERVVNRVGSLTAPAADRLRLGAVGVLGCATTQKRSRSIFVHRVVEEANQPRFQSGWGVQLALPNHEYPHTKHLKSRLLSGVTHLIRLDFLLPPITVPLRQPTSLASVAVPETSMDEYAPPARNVRYVWTSRQGRWANTVPVSLPPQELPHCSLCSRVTNAHRLHTLRRRFVRGEKVRK